MVNKPTALFWAMTLFFKGHGDPTYQLVRSVVFFPIHSMTRKLRSAPTEPTAAENMTRGARLWWRPRCPRRAPLASSRRPADLPDPGTSRGPVLSSGHLDPHNPIFREQLAPFVGLVQRNRQFQGRGSRLPGSLLLRGTSCRIGTPF